MRFKAKAVAHSKYLKIILGWQKYTSMYVCMYLSASK